jgi:23S rRNA pseudouridine1911/1915/1917 synthase
VTRRRAWARAALVVALVLVADQVSKAVVRSSLALGERRHVLPLLDLERSNNKGIAFGALGDGGAVVLVIVAIALVALIAYFAAHATRRLAWLPTGLLLGGAVGNIIDRARDGAVTDFIHLPHWPTFNVADMAITAGVVAFGIAYEDDDLLVVDKPAGLVVHPARGHRAGTLAQALTGRAAGGEDPARAGIVHRLDRDTSGLLVVAKGEAAHRALQAALQERGITREYLALVDGLPPARSGTIDAPIGRDRRVRTRHSIETDDPRVAVTHFEVAEHLAHYALLRVRLETGRTHQIRVHLQAIGHPVAGDPEYGRPGVLGLGRQFLHAAHLAFEHPRTGARVEADSPLPGDLEAALERARAGER